MTRGRRTTDRSFGILKGLFDHYDEAVMLLSPKGELLYANPNAENFLERAFKRRDFPDELKDLFKTKLETLLELPPDLPKRDEFILPLGSRVFLMKIVVVNLKKGFPNLLIALRDITLIRKVQEDALKTLEKVTEIFMEPLTTIKGFVETLLDGAYSDPKVTWEFLKIIESETNKMIKTLVEVQSRLKFHVEKPKLNLEEVDSFQFLNDLMRTFLERAMEKGIKFSWEFQPNLPKIVADLEKLKTILFNILDNAFKFSDYKRNFLPDFSPEVYFEARFDRDTFEFIVRDNGIGIPEAELSKVGERFFKASNARDTYGVGLGLAVAMDLIKLHGGDLRLESKEGEGVTVRILLPYLKEKLGAEEPEERFNG